VGAEPRTLRWTCDQGIEIQDSASSESCDRHCPVESVLVLHYRPREAGRFTGKNGTAGPQTEFEEEPAGSPRLRGSGASARLERGDHAIEQMPTVVTAQDYFTGAIRMGHQAGNIELFVGNARNVQQ
jgi:hypothetical protein